MHIMHMQHCGFIVLCAFLCASLVLAVPAGSSIAPPPPLEPLSLFAKHQDPRRPWVRFRDAIIERIWGITRKPSSSYPLKDPYHDQFPPSKVLARYGSDVVLRFELRDPGEAAALANAIDVLFLDVWASTDAFVDLRLAQEMVSCWTKGRKCQAELTHPDPIAARAPTTIASISSCLAHRRPLGHDL